MALFHEHPQKGEDSERPLAEHFARPKGGRGGRERLGEEHGDGPLGTCLGERPWGVGGKAGHL